MQPNPTMIFDDWLKHKSMDKSWITVAQHDVTERDGWEKELNMISVLAPQGSDEVLLTYGDWLVNDLGNVDVGADGYCIKVKMEDHVGENGDVRIEPFTFWRSWNETWPGRFEVIQNFILFYNLHFDAKNNKYVSVNDAGETVDVVRVKYDESHEKIEIHAKFLRNYLACHGCVLVRQHDNRTYSDLTLAEFGIKPDKGRRLGDSDYVFELTVVDVELPNKWKSFSRLLGKDIIRSFDKCKDLLGFPKEKCEFIVGVDEQGEEKMMSPDDTDDVNNFLTPVYFKREVLKKYYDSTNYKVEHYGRISCGNYWGISAPTNNADLILMFLGDLKRLPSNEQYHWKNYNVHPECGITESSQDDNVDGVFVNSDDAVYNFKKSLRNFQEKFEKRFDFKLFRPLGEDDAYKEGSIRVPLNDDMGEFEGQIQYLAMLLPESINRSQLEQKMALLLSEPTRFTGSVDRKQLERLNAKYGAKSEDKPERIPMLEDFLLCESLPTAIISHLRTIQNLRSSGVAHRKGSKHEKNVSKYGLDKTSRKEFIRKMFVDMTSAFNDLTYSISK